MSVENLHICEDMYSKILVRCALSLWQSVYGLRLLHVGTTFSTTA